MDRSIVEDIFSLRFLPLSRTSTFIWAGISIAVIALIDWRLDINISFGFLYLFPMLLIGSRLSRLQIAGAAALCTVLTEAFDPFLWIAHVGIPRLILSFTAFFSAALYSSETARRRRLSNRHLEEMRAETELRRRTEEQLDFLIANSPATIFTLDASGKILLANESAHRLLGVEQGKLQGQPIDPFLPALANVPPISSETPVFHTEMECQGRKKDGEAFMAHVWFSTYQTRDGPRLAAVVSDASEDLRDRAEFNLQQLLTGSRVLMGALSHEIRNICGAIASLHAKLTRDPQMASSPDFNTFGTLVLGLEKMAGLELRHAVRPAAESLDLRPVLEELRIIIESSFAESEISIRWQTPAHVPRVLAERQALLQAFLNIAKNSERAMHGREPRELIVRTCVEGDLVAIRFIDSGPGVSNPEQLFEPFQPGAEASGLGLYLSRSFMRAFQGDILHEPQAQGCCFTVLLAIAAQNQPQTAEAS